MFYADYLFSKKNWLKKVWILAHFDKKLTKTQIFDIDIGQVIEEILGPDVRLAIRLLGHLLLGLSRIYFHRACFVLEECSTFLFKLSVPKTNKSGKYNDGKASKSKKRKAGLNISYYAKLEDITLKDESMPVMRIMEETLEESKIQPFEEEVMRSFIGGLEESAFELSKISAKTPKLEVNAETSHMFAPVEVVVPDLTLPLERSRISEVTLVGNRGRKRKFQHIKDVETVFDKKSFKHMLEDPSLLMRETTEDNIERIVLPQLFNTPSFGLVSGTLLKLYESSPSKMRVHLPELSPIPRMEELYDNIQPLDNFEPTLEVTNFPDLNISGDLNTTLKDLSEHMGSRCSTSFREFTAIDNCEIVCRKFMAILNLYKMDFINLKQIKPFGDIEITGN
ncbi:Double-strand-break repair protein rad21 [Thelohanellus kitauei]|uniref:Double-strand-break repair protein rad21 n=1 Tax=Thelohanellus kitauei TaxID=669202 RepID=A0A0C2IRI0_THEKT|nr:Double-strand-break repair protein rad21 [Thelohanellus kitauei]